MFYKYLYRYLIGNIFEALIIQSKHYHNIILLFENIFETDYVIYTINCNVLEETGFKDTAYIIILTLHVFDV